MTKFAIVTCYTWLAVSVNGFAFISPSRRGVGLPTSSKPLTHRSLVSDWTSLTTAIEYFDGSQVVDSVVVSNVFWSSLISKIVSLVIGQLLATLVFGLLATVAAQQIGNVGSFVSNKVFQKQTTFRRMPEPGTEQLIEPDFGKLFICILVDVVGSSSELVPIFGEVTDVIWAPIAGLILRSLYSSNILFGLEFAEEILPFTDILPLATICWVVDTYFSSSSLAELLNLGTYSTEERMQKSPATSSWVIDVTSQTTDDEQKNLSAAERSERRERRER